MRGGATIGSSAKRGFSSNSFASADAPESGARAFVFRQALISSTARFTSNNRGRPPTPIAFRLGVTARQIVLFVRDASATTKWVASGSFPLSTHSTEA